MDLDVAIFTVDNILNFVYDEWNDGSYYEFTEKFELLIAIAAPATFTMMENKDALGVDRP